MGSTSILPDILIISWCLTRCAGCVSFATVFQVLLVGHLKGVKVQEAKKKIQQLMVERGEAVLYQEPEKKVVSRTGDVCVVALCDQW